MSKHQTEDFPLGESLDPRNSLPNIVKKSDVVRWETALKRTLCLWMQDTRSPFSTVRRELQSTILRRHSSSRFRAPSSKISSPSDSGVKTKINEFDLVNAALPLVTDLHRHGSLPAILFNYDRKYCERIADVVLNQLVHAENSWKHSDLRWAQKMTEYEAWKKTSSHPKCQKKRGGSTFRPQEGSGFSKIDLAREEASKEFSMWESFDPEAPLDMFSFADRTKLLDSELDSIVHSLKYANLEPHITEALRRGIGVHHAGMNRQYRQV